MQMLEPDGARTATLLALLDSLDDVPVAIMDNKSSGLCYANPAFEEVCPCESREAFLHHLQTAPSPSSGKKPGYIDWHGRKVAVAWEERIEGGSGHLHTAGTKGWGI